MLKHYQQDEAEQILREAVRRAAEQEAAQATGNAPIPHERLVAMAEELGVPLETLGAVLDERAAMGAKQREQAALRAAEQGERQTFIAERRADFYPHLWAYIGVNVMLIAINALTSPGHFWAAYPLLGWGIGLFCHAMSALPTRGPTFEKEFGGWRDKRRKKAEKEEKLRQRQAERRAAEAAKTQARDAKNSDNRGRGARSYDSAGDLAADAVQHAAGAVQEAVGEVAKAVDEVLRSGALDWRVTNERSRRRYEQAARDRSQRRRGWPDDQDDD